MGNRRRGLYSAMVEQKDYDNKEELKAKKSALVYELSSICVTRHTSRC
jgi:hypothetical protein